MRIAIDGRYVQDHFPGIGRYTYNLVRALSALGESAEWLVITNPRLPNTRYDLAALAAQPGVRLVACDVGTFSLQEQTTLPREVARLGVSLLHSPYYVKPYRLPVPSVLTYYDVIGLVYPNALPSARARALFRLLSWLALAGADKVILLSRSAQRDVMRHFRVAEARTTVIYPAADPQFQPQPADVVERVRQKYGLEGPYVLYVGINKPHKNVETLVEAWARAKPQAMLVLAGREDPRYPQARQRVAALGMERRVRFLGDVPEADLPALYSGAALFAFPSRYEGFGLPVLEAMACGAPVVSSDAASLPEVVGDAGPLLSPADVEAWADALVRLLGNPATLEAMRGRSLARAAEFSWEKAARDTMAVYREVAS
ncbi:MAG: glycosyltransferase family 1 protein [Anaerolineae bacterium]|jgi:alpha-1,3-rhamnosyl/mannosyltransferase|nr:glycosyltransferase family 1 protein [Anaerolineae bacterium]